MSESAKHNYLKRPLPHDKEIQGWLPESLHALEYLKSLRGGSQEHEICAEREASEDAQSSTDTSRSTSSASTPQPTCTPANSKRPVHDETRNWQSASLDALAYLKARDFDLRVTQRPDQLPDDCSTAYSHITPAFSSTKSHKSSSVRLAPIDGNLYDNVETGREQPVDINPPGFDLPADLGPPAKKRKIKSEISSHNDYGLAEFESAAPSWIDIAPISSRSPSSRLEKLPEEIVNRIFDFIEDMALPRAFPLLQKALKKHPFYQCCVTLFGEQSYSYKKVSEPQLDLPRYKHFALNGLTDYGHRSRLRMAVQVTRQGWFNAGLFRRVQRYFICETLKMKWPDGTSSLRACGPHTVEQIKRWLAEKDRMKMLETAQLTIKRSKFKIFVQVNPAVVKFLKRFGKHSSTMTANFPEQYSRDLHGARPRLSDSWFQSCLSEEGSRLMQISLEGIGALKKEPKGFDYNKWPFERVSQSLLEAAVEENRLEYFMAHVGNGSEVMTKMGIDIGTLFARIATVGLQSMAKTPEVTPYKEVDATTFFQILFSIAPRTLADRNDCDGSDAVYPVVVCHRWAQKQKKSSNFIKYVIDYLRLQNPEVAEVQLHNNPISSDPGAKTRARDRERKSRYKKKSLPSRGKSKQLHNDPDPSSPEARTREGDRGRINQRHKMNLRNRGKGMQNQKQPTKHPLPNDKVAPGDKKRGAALQVVINNRAFKSRR